jgi:hypothetical protein
MTHKIPYTRRHDDVAGKLPGTHCTPPHMLPFDARNEGSNACRGMHDMAGNDCQSLRKGLRGAFAPAEIVLHGGAVLVETRVEIAWFQRLRLEYEKCVFSCAFNSNLSHCNTAVTHPVRIGQGTCGVVAGAYIVHFSAQPEPFLVTETTQHSLKRCLRRP